MRASPFISIDKQAAIGALKATGSNDLDVLYAARAKLVGAGAVPRWVGLGLVLASIPVVVTRAGLVGTVACLLAGWWFLDRGIRNVRMVESGYAEHVAAVRQLQADRPKG